MGLGIYVHIPFCVTKCPYCDFISYGRKGKNGYTGEDIGRYLSLLSQEAVMYRKLIAGKTAQTIYLGGGTPTCLSGGQLFALLQMLKKAYLPDEDAEITVEANPGTLDKEKLYALGEGGCNRLSLGAQSFNQQELKSLGRIHSPQEVFEAYKMVRDAGFGDINLDLMYGLPGQDLMSWRDSLNIAASLEPEHLSIYQLKIEKGTPFFELKKKGRLEEPEEEIALRMYEETIEFLTKKGYHHYEISNFAKHKKESRHNRLYWLNREYLGLGAGASGYLGGIRYTNEGGLGAYGTAIREGRLPVKEEERIGQKLAMAETVFLGLRLLEGLNKNAFSGRFGVDISEVYGDTVERLKGQGLLEESDESIYLTRKGLYIANIVFMEFLP